MGIDGMRVGGGRCPPLIVGGLLLACFLLVCNWWSLSTENTELLRQIDELSQHLKISAEERDQCVTLRSKLEQRYKKTEDDVARLHVQLEEEKESQKTKEEAVTMCRSELDSLNKLDVTRTATLDTLRLEKETINGQLEEKKEENKRLQRELEKVQEELNQLKLTINAPGSNHKASPAEALPDDAVVDNGTVPGGDQETQNALDAAPNNDNNDGIGGEISDNPEDEEVAAQDGIKNQGMKSPTDTERI
ncbi:tax1-binding protein 1 homolog B-like isoform X3 [Athalia rosae]|uniref:tax1-binding protein 1 homolog B-like isoform X3 n=1 Tax=Athalia rosae TaxID=37344 RepID=UPI0020332AB6|nr:tax1-binding protein 1 homolog B-like isoform X3 [Athalia rosae]